MDRTVKVVFEETGSLLNKPALCPHCSTVTGFENFQDLSLNIRVDSGPAIARTVRTSVCRLCRGLVIGTITSEKPGGAKHHWPPCTWPDRAPDGLDRESMRCYNEARAVLPYSPMAAAALARRAVQHVMRAKLGLDDYLLKDAIAKAANRDELAKPTRHALDHVRELGNWAAHATEDGAGRIIEVEPGEAEYTLETLEMLFDDLYAGPQRISAMEQRLKDRKSGITAAGPAPSHFRHDPTTSA